MIKFRGQAGLSQAEAADLSGVPLDALRRYETGISAAIPYSVVAKLAEAYGRATDHFNMPEPPAPPKRDELPVFFLRTRPGAKVDEATLRKLEAEVERANSARGKK